MAASSTDHTNPQRQGRQAGRSRHVSTKQPTPTRTLLRGRTDGGTARVWGARPARCSWSAYLYAMAQGRHRLSQARQVLQAPGALGTPCAGCKLQITAPQLQAASGARHSFHRAAAAGSQSGRLHFADLQQQAACWVWDTSQLKHRAATQAALLIRNQSACHASGAEATGNPGRLHLFPKARQLH